MDPEHSSTVGRIGRRALKIGGVVAMVALMFVVHQFFTGGTLFSHGSDMEAQIDELALGDQPASPLYRALKEEFPADYDRFKAHLGSVAQHGANDAQVAAARDRWMQRFAMSLAEDFAKAPQAAIFRVRDDYAALVEVLAKESTRRCAGFGMTGRVMDVPSSDPASRLLATATASQLRAAAAGRKSPTARTEPTQADGTELARQLARSGVSDEELDAFFGGGMGRMPRYRQCALTVALYRSLGTISDGASERLSAKLLAPQAPE